MIVGDAERRKYEAHVELAARHGVSSVLPIKVETTFYVSHVAEGVSASIIEIPVSVDAEISILSDGVSRLGLVGWRDSRQSDAFRSATYFLSHGEVPQLLRTPGLAYGEDVSCIASDPFALVEFLVNQSEREVRGYCEPTAELTRDAIATYVTGRIIEGVKACSMVVSKGGDARMVRATDVPHFKITTSGGRPPVDAAHWDVVVDRPEDIESMNWKDLGLRFEPWEAEIAGRVVRAYGVKHERTVPVGIDFRGYAGGNLDVDLAVVNRYAMKSLLPLFVKKVMLDLSNSEFESEGAISAYTSAAYAAASKNQWGSVELEEALSSLHDLWKHDKRFSEFSRSKGWDSMLSPFEIIAARAEAFPWRGTAPQVATHSHSPRP
jgi:hypothetical protein